MLVNFGGFVQASTVDWRGRAVCTVFLRGCPLRCSYCQNASIQTGSDLRELEEVVGMIREASPLVSGVVFSGGEPTMQAEALAALAGAAREMGLATALQTNGYFPDVLIALLSRRLLDRVAIDYKTKWEGFSGRLQGYRGTNRETYQERVTASIAACKEAADKGDLREFEVVATIFPGNENEVFSISQATRGIPLVLQQGERKSSWAAWTMPKGVDVAPPLPDRPPLSLHELQHLADQLARPVRIRTREGGELAYESDRRRWIACER